MKWWWVGVVVLLVPVGSQAEEFTEPAVEIDIEGLSTNRPNNLPGWEHQKFTFFVVEPKENLSDVSLHMEFSLPGRSGDNRGHLQAERCAVFFVNTTQSTVQVFPTRHGENLDVRIPNFGVGIQIGVLVGWKDNTQSIWTASLTIHSAEGRQRHHWENTVVRNLNRLHRPNFFLKWLGTADYPLETVPLGAVCDQLNISEIWPPSS